LGTALFEEVAFRGVIYGTWRHSGASPRTAAVVTAAAFGLWHLIPSGQALRGNPLSARIRTRRAEAGVVVAGALLTGISSLGFSWMRRRSGSLIAPWIAHAAINTFTYLAGVGAWGRSATSTGGGSLSD
jgi:membrane protease YdiL (CAAX protease family)